jgi:hypothetical protein
MRSVKQYVDVFLAKRVEKWVSPHTTFMVSQNLVYYLDDRVSALEDPTDLLNSFDKRLFEFRFVLGSSVRA